MRFTIGVQLGMVDMYILNFWLILNNLIVLQCIRAFVWERLKTYWNALAYCFEGIALSSISNNVFQLILARNILGKLQISIGLVKALLHQ